MKKSSKIPVQQNSSEQRKESFFPAQNRESKGLSSSEKQGDHLKATEDSQLTSQSNEGATMDNSVVEKKDVKSSQEHSTKLNGTIQSEMEQGFGVSFSDVNIHTGSHAEEMNEDMGSQAFTYGNDIYFNKGNYNPDSAEGKALLAHELTHTIQQDTARVDTSKATNDNELEKDSNEATKGFFERLLFGGKSEKSIMPKMKSGLRIATCDGEKEKKPATPTRDQLLEAFKKKREQGDPNIPAAKSGIKTAAVDLGTNDKVMDSYHRFQEKEVADGDLTWGFFFSRDSTLTSATKKPKSFSTWKEFNKLGPRTRRTLFMISRITGEVVHNKYSETKDNLKKLQKAYEYWPSDQYAVHQSGSSEASNTCNVFVGNALYEAGYTGNNNGKFWSAKQVYEGAEGAFVEIDKAFTMPGDIVAYGGHVGVVVKVDVENEQFITREGYITPKGSERDRNFDELLGLKKPELKVMRKP